MRQAGTVPDETQARRLIDYLMSIGIRGKTDRSGDAWAIWVFDDPIDRAALIKTGSMLFIPSKVLRKIGIHATHTIIATFAEKPIPKISMKAGSSASGASPRVNSITGATNQSIILNV